MKKVLLVLVLLLVAFATAAICAQQTAVPSSVGPATSTTSSIPTHVVYISCLLDGAPTSVRITIDQVNSAGKYVRGTQKEKWVLGGRASFSLIANRKYNILAEYFPPDQVRSEAAHPSSMRPVGGYIYANQVITNLNRNMTIVMNLADHGSSLPREPLGP